MQPLYSSSGKWNEWIAGLPGPHLLQTYEWGQVKAKYGWEPMYVIWPNRSNRFYLSGQLEKVDGSDLVAAALVLKRRIPVRGLAARLNILYLPKGPLLDWSDASLRKRVLDDLQSLAKGQGAIFLKIDPDVVLGKGIPDRNPTSTDVGGQEQNSTGQDVMSELAHRGWLFSSEQVQFRNTVMVDLSASEGELLARMKQKTRYNIRLASKKGIVVRIGNRDDLPMLYKMYAETSLRDGFVIRDEGYYQTVWQTFMQSPVENRQSIIVNRKLSIPSAEPLIAEVDGEPVAAIFVFYFANRAYYIYGMSRDVHREKMPNHLLQWEAMRRAKAAGCDIYDLWGAPEAFDENDPMWGVFRFKEGLGGQVVRTLGAWDYTPKPLWYRLYSQVIPRALDVMRSRGKERTRQALE